MRKIEMNFACENRAEKVAGFIVMGLVLVLVSACQTASLEDAAPRSVPPASAQDTGPDGEAKTEKTGIGMVSPLPVPFNQPPKVERKEFVDQGIQGNGDFPNLGTERNAALPQLSDAESNELKREFEAIKKAGPKGTQTEAAYRRRLAELRRIAKNHAKETEAEITK